MAQAGIHALLGATTSKVTPKRDWLMLGIILGSLFPDLDNYAVAIATLTKLNSHNFHRTATHSLLAILLTVVVFVVVAQVTKQPHWANLGVGLGIGIALHIALDLLIWFNGVELFWPLGGWLNLWERVTPPAWFVKLLDPAEFFFFALFFAWLAKVAQDHKTNSDFLGALRVWIIAMLLLLVVFTALAYAMSRGFQTIYGVFYLISINTAIAITIRMRQTIEALD